MQRVGVTDDFRVREGSGSASERYKTEAADTTSICSQSLCVLHIVG